MIKLLLLFIILTLPVNAMAEIFKCDSPKGISMYSKENHKVINDGFVGVQPIVVLEGEEMTVIWGDSKQAGRGADKVWKAIIFHRSSEVVSGLVVDDGQFGSASMLYTLDVKRGYLYFSTHKQSNLLNSTSVSSFVSKCSH